jgi:hypothetical protein
LPLFLSDDAWRAPARCGETPMELIGFLIFLVSWELMLAYEKMVGLTR